MSSRLNFGEKFTVSFFENLHWNRYSDFYRKQFFKDLRALSEKYSSVQFLLKPHHAGQWTTKNRKTNHEFPSNVLILDPMDARWEPYTGPEYILASNLVVTTPSTIACDAAIMGKPVVVVAYDLSLEAYNPLPLMRQEEDYCKAIEEVIMKTKDHLFYAQEFIAKNLTNTQAAEKIVNLILD